MTKNENSNSTINHEQTKCVSEFRFVRVRCPIYCSILTRCGIATVVVEFTFGRYLISVDDIEVISSLRELHNDRVRRYALAFVQSTEPRSNAIGRSTNHILRRNIRLVFVVYAEFVIKVTIREIM